MVASSMNEGIQSLRVKKEVTIAAQIDIAFEAMLEELGPANELPDGTPMPMVLEAWPGGRWYRDLGNDTGHFWGHVQVLKPPKLMEISGPLFMSFPCANHIQSRFVTEGLGTKLQLLHRGFGEIPTDHLDRVSIGWWHGIQLIKKIAEARAKSNQ